MTTVMTRPDIGPFFNAEGRFQAFGLLLLAFLLWPSALQAHPQDEDIILDIELGEMTLDKAQFDQEYLAALKRKHLRRLAAMSWHDKVKLYAIAGFEHIIPKGLDHILFVLGLFFASLLLTSLLWQVTAFTLAHSVTLGMASLGMISAPGNLVEPLIALSIVWVAVENCVFKRTSHWRFAVVFLFGLLHGLGFASVLSDYGLPKNDLVPSLLAFNVGVELGQIAVIFIAFAATYHLRDKANYRNAVQIPLSIGIGLVGAYWFIERTIF